MCQLLFTPKPFVLKNISRKYLLMGVSFEPPLLAKCVHYKIVYKSTAHLDIVACTE